MLLRTPLALVTLLLALPAAARGGDLPPLETRLLAWSIDVSAGGRFDDVRMCVASAAGTRGGLAADVALTLELGQRDAPAVLTLSVPLMRPLLFGAAFRMLQLEPEAMLLFPGPRLGPLALRWGPSLGLSLHYGPDFRSGLGDDERGDDFFALGPRLGAFFGLHLPRPHGAFDMVFALRPYVTPLWGVGDAANHAGVVIGALATVRFRFARVWPAT